MSLHITTLSASYLWLVQRNFHYVQINAAVNLHFKVSTVGATTPPYLQLKMWYPQILCKDLFLITPCTFSFVRSPLDACDLPNNATYCI